MRVRMYCKSASRMNPEKIEDFLYYFKQELQHRNVQLQLIYFKSENERENMLVPQGPANINSTVNMNLPQTNITIIDSNLEIQTVNQILSDSVSDEQLVFLYKEGSFVCIPPDTYQMKGKRGMLDIRNLNETTSSQVTLEDAVCTTTLYPKPKEGKVFDVCLFYNDHNHLSLDHIINPLIDLGTNSVIISEHLKVCDWVKLKNSKVGIQNPAKTSDVKPLILGSRVAVILGTETDIMNDRISYEILRSMALGVPVISNYVPTKENGLIHHNNFLYLSKIENFKNLIFETLTDKAKNINITSNALRLVTKKYSMYHRVNDFLDFIGEFVHTLHTHPHKTQA